MNPGSWPRGVRPRSGNMMRGDMTGGPPQSFTPENLKRGTDGKSRSKRLD